MPSVKIRTAMSKKTGSMPKLSKDVKATGDSRKGKSKIREGGMYNPAVPREFGVSKKRESVPSKMTTKKVTTVATPKNKEVTMQTRSTVTAKTNKKGKIKK